MRVCFNDAIRLMVMKMRLEMKNRSQRYGINRPSPRHGPKYTKYKMCVSIMMLICINPLTNLDPSTFLAIFLKLL